MTRPLSELDHAYLAAHEQSRRLHEAPPPTVADLAHAALDEMLVSTSDLTASWTGAVNASPSVPTDPEGDPT